VPARSDWEDEDWENFEAPGAAKPGLTATEALEKGAYNAAKFAGEDEEEEAPKYSVPETQAKKEVVKRFAHKEGMGVQAYVGDVTDKLQQQRLQEEGELALLKDMMGGGGKSELDAFVPKTKEDFERYADLVSAQYVTAFHGKPGAHYKAMIKQLVKAVMAPCSAADLRDFSKDVAAIAKDKDREEKERAESLKRRGKKGKPLRMAADDQDLTGGLEGDKYAAMADIEDDFM